MSPASSPTIRVQLDALTMLSNRIRIAAETARQLTADCRRAETTVAATGDAAAAGLIGDFLRAWSRGGAMIADDADGLAGLLAGTVAAYADTEHAIAAAAQQQTGPAASAPGSGPPPGPGPGSAPSPGSGSAPSPGPGPGAGP